MIFTWLLTGLSICGVVFNIQKKRSGFAIWIFTNGTWAFVDFYKGIPSQGCLFLVYFVLAIWGWFHWAPKDKYELPN
jgi:hypothetical protein